MLVTPNEAAPWLREAALLPIDELAMFVIGEPSHSHAHVVALTAWKSDLAEDQWKAMLTHSQQCATC